MTNTQQGKLTEDDLAHQIACELASIDGYDPEDMHCGLYDLRWSGGSAPEPLGDTFSLEYLPKGYRIARAIEAEVEARTAKKMDALVEALQDMIAAYTGPNVNEEGRRYRAFKKAQAALAAHQQDTVAEKGEK